MNESDPSALPFTGERFTPECVREIWYEHWHRYAFVRRLAAGKRVLDAACGEGYGSALLAGVASEVVGIDIDAASVAHARSRYGAHANLRFEQGDATNLDIPPGRFDLVVSFETLEHVEAQERMVSGFRRALGDDGVLVISSPDKRTYSEIAGFRNEFHVRELYREELLALLAPHFQNVRLYGQKLLFQSALWALDETQERSETWTASASGDSLSASLDYAPLYFIAVCARGELPEALPPMSFFGDREESVYAHYNHEVQKNMKAGERIAELEAEIQKLREDAARPSATVSRRTPWWRRQRTNE